MEKNEAIGEEKRGIAVQTRLYLCICEVSSGAETTDKQLRADGKANGWSRQDEARARWTVDIWTTTRPGCCDVEFELQ